MHVEGLLNELQMIQQVQETKYNPIYSLWLDLQGKLKFD